MDSPVDFKQDYILENEMVRLRPLEFSDYEYLISFSEGEPELWTFSMHSASGRENLKQYILSAISAREQNKEYAFIVFDKIKKQYAGSTRFYDIQPLYATLQLGYTWYGKSFQGTGLNKNCKYLLLEFAFEKWGMERIEFRADNENEKSIAAMKSIGCKVDGILRSNLPKPNGIRRDSIILSILRNEWLEEIKPMLHSKIQLDKF